MSGPIATFTARSKIEVLGGAVGQQLDVELDAVCTQRDDLLDVGHERIESGLVGEPDIVVEHPAGPGMDADTGPGGMEGVEELLHPADQYPSPSQIAIS